MPRLLNRLTSMTRRVLGTEHLRREIAELRSETERMSRVLQEEIRLAHRAELNDLAELVRRSAGEIPGLVSRSATELAGVVGRSAQAPDSTSSKVCQHILVNQYRESLLRGDPLPRFEDVEFRAYSQNGEDGLLLYIFSLIGMGQRRCVEICAGDGTQCNTANLIINHSWHGLMFDGDEALVQRGRSFYANHGDTFCLPPKFVHAWITRENINQIVADNGFEGPADLLSLDIDGVDYWVWDALDVLRPRVVIAEVQCIWGAERAVTVPYSPAFKTRYIDGFGVYSGASLPAFVKLAERKGYRLVGVQSLGFNAVFIRDGVGEDVFPEVEVRTCVNRPFVEWAQQSLLGKVENLPWVEV